MVAINVPKKNNVNFIQGLYKIPIIAEFGLSSALLLAHSTVTGEGKVTPDPPVAELSIFLSHNFLAWEVTIGSLYALLIRTYATTVTKRSLQDGLRAHAAVRGLVEQVRVVPAMFALSE